MIIVGMPKSEKVYIKVQVTKEHFELLRTKAEQENRSLANYTGILLEREVRLMVANKRE